MQVFLGATIVICLLLIHSLIGENNRLQAQLKTTTDLNSRLSTEMQEINEEMEKSQAQNSLLNMQTTKALVTAYTCDSSMNSAQKAMNCPNGITATGTVPKHKQTAACDHANLGKQFYVDGIGVVTCEDLGGAIKGGNRFDLYLSSYTEAIAFGKKTLNYIQL